MKKNACLALWAIAYSKQFFEVFLINFLKMGYAPKTNGYEYKNKDKHKKKKFCTVGTL
jgi:aminopeptidase C